MYSDVDFILTIYPIFVRVVVLMKKYLSLINFITIVIIITITLISSIMITYGSLSTYHYSLIVNGGGFLVLIIYLLDKFINKKKFDIYDCFVFILSILACLSLIDAYKIDVAIFGYTNRNEGLLMILSYYILFLSSRNINKEVYKKIIIGIILGIGFINLVYGFLQVYYPNFSLFEIKGSWMYAKGFVGNSNFFGTLMTIAYSLSLGLFIKCIGNKIVSKCGLFLLLCLFSFGLIISGCLSAYLSIVLIFGLLFISVVYLLFKKEYSLELKRLLLIIIALLTLVSSYKIFTLHNDVIETEIMEFLGQSESISEGKVLDTYGTGRIYIWKNTLKEIKNHYLTGVGIDNFYYAFKPRLKDKISGFYIDKAHNDYLQKMLCEGVLSGLVFIIFLLSIFFKRIDVFKEDNKITIALFLAFTSYCIQAFFNVSITRIAPLYFILMGLLITKGDDGYEKSNV